MLMKEKQSINHFIAPNAIKNYPAIQDIAPKNRTNTIGTISIRN